MGEKNDNGEVDLKEICQYEELDWFSSNWGLLENSCAYRIEPFDFISRGIKSYLLKIVISLAKTVNETCVSHQWTNDYSSKHAI